MVVVVVAAVVVVGGAAEVVVVVVVVVVEAVAVVVLLPGVSEVPCGTEAEFADGATLGTGSTCSVPRAAGKPVASFAAVVEVAVAGGVAVVVVETTATAVVAVSKPLSQRQAKFLCAS